MNILNRARTHDATIIAANSGHDGAFVVVRDGELLLSAEAEHGSKPRHMPTSGYFILDKLQKLDCTPAVIATSGWTDAFPFQSAASPYHGIDQRLTTLTPTVICGSKTQLFESTHERSHIFCTYGMSPFPQGKPCYVLVWEGDIGSFYEVDEQLCIRQHGPVMHFPGYKYSFLFDLANPSATVATWALDNAGKLMALAGFSKRVDATKEEERFIARVLKEVAPPYTDKGQFADIPYMNCGVTNPAFREVVAVFSETIFNTFFSFAQKHLRKGYPLLIAGGCGLNCEWNSRWRACGLFEDVFVPPVANDSGSAIGTAIDAQFSVYGNAKLNWNVYSGEPFIDDGSEESFRKTELDYDLVAELLTKDHIVAWVQGRSEIGPRALGNRSLLAAPFSPRIKERLNAIKKREWYRPIAPVCTEEDAEKLFGLKGSSPYMLYFSSVRAKGLNAVTHVDGSARVQTVTREQNDPLWRLLMAFRHRSGVSALCNTSLNRKGKGFINQSRDLFSFARETGIDTVVIGSHMYRRQHSSSSSSRRQSPELSMP